MLCPPPPSAYTHSTIYINIYISSNELAIPKVRDFFRPIDSATTTYCDMLQKYGTHQWSPNGVDWFEVGFTGSSHYGGSAEYWPRDNGRIGDERQYLSFWGGLAGAVLGGCCSSSTAVAKTGWGQSLTLSYAVQLQPLPPNTGMSLVVEVAGTTLANDAFWAVECQKIPSNTEFLVLDMGAVRRKNITIRWNITA